MQFPSIQPLSRERAHKLAAGRDRRRLLGQLASATNRKEIDAARQAQKAWLTANPDDFGALEGGEDLAHAEEVLAALQAEEMPRVDS